MHSAAVFSFALFSAVNAAAIVNAGLEIRTPAPTAMAKRSLTDDVLSALPSEWAGQIASGISVALESGAVITTAAFASAVDDTATSLLGDLGSLTITASDSLETGTATISEDLSHTLTHSSDGLETGSADSSATVLGGSSGGISTAVRTTGTVAATGATLRAPGATATSGTASGSGSGSGSGTGSTTSNSNAQGQNTAGGLVDPNAKKGAAGRTAADKTIVVALINAAGLVAIVAFFL